ncbi:carbon-nitrogen hydrolase family protein [Aeromicrobium sp. Leaf350]|uniref:carbon-nitrogen hydrolase family protein n=1 Tax=Aeromicrobium sp. Leaf350 TaxID=2876565 RepID=UPI001E54BEF7|nr:carbon-nitrogen hydrolase family protein [Aeromicrobium sp. Leaf350]
MSTTRFRVAAAHASPVLLDLDASIEKACGLIAEAGEAGVQLLVFPEVFVPGFPYWINLYAPLDQFGLNLRYRASSVELPGPEIARVQEAARDAAVNVVLGVSERDGGTLYNTQVHIDENGVILGKHRKLQPTYAERYVWGQGDGSTLSVFDTRVGKVGGLACWEHTLNLARQALIVQGEQIHAASWPSLSTQRGMEDSFDLQVEAMSRTHALTGQCFVIVAENPLTQDMIDVMESELGPQDIQPAGGGWSAIIHPTGTDVVPPHTGAEEKLLVADIDLADIEFLNLLIDGRGHYARREVLRLWIDDEPKGTVVHRADTGETA